MVTLVFVNQSPGRAAAASRDSHLTLRRVERQQYLIERLHASRTRLTHGRLADELGVTERTIARMGGATEGDFLDLDAVRAWGASIAATLCNSL